ncbi:MAG TPA: hypothetical protein VFJ27_08905 [Terriglobia bacterium]|nr:hypothetical protein [Terriglobia bacterium]
MPIGKLCKSFFWGGRNQHALAQKSTVSPEEVATLPFILYERKTVMRRLIDQFFAGIGMGSENRDGHGEHRSHQEPCLALRGTVSS